MCTKCCARHHVSPIRLAEEVPTFHQQPARHTPPGGPQIPRRVHRRVLGAALLIDLGLACLASFLFLLHCVYHCLVYALLSLLSAPGVSSLVGLPSTSSLLSLSLGCSCLLLLGLSKPYVNLGQLDKSPKRYTKVESFGSFFEPYFLLDNVVLNKKAGYLVFSPFLFGENVVLVNRGWVDNYSRQKFPEITTPKEKINIRSY